MTDYGDAWYILAKNGHAPGEGPSQYTNVTNEPPVGWTPFSPSSPWNTQIPINATVTADSPAIVTWLNGLTGGPTNPFVGVAGTTQDFSHPTYYAKSGDPLTRVLVAAGQRDPSMNGKTRCTTMHEALIPLPANSPQADGSDGHLCIVTDTAAYELWGARSWTPSQGAGYPRMGTRWATRVPLAGDGTPDDGFGATAADVSLLAGQIRVCELEAGVIPHVIAMTTKYVRWNVMTGPALGTATPDPGTSPGDSNDLARPMTGSRLRLNYSGAEIAALGLPTWQAAIITAWATYGAIIMDTGGASYNIQLESSAPDVAAGVTDRWQAFAQTQGWSKSGGFYVMPYSTGVDWSRLQVVTF